MSSSRRRFRTNAAAVAAAASTLAHEARALAPGLPNVTIPDELVFTSTKRLAALIRARKVSATEAVTAYYARLDDANRKTNAVVQMCHDRALAEAAECDRQLARGRLKGPLHGVPFTIKDSFDTEGVVTTIGSEGRKGFVPNKDATVVARVRAAGGILLGKTNTPEFTLSRTTDNYIYGRTLNPYKLTHSPGGSSGGAGANVAQGGAAFDIGSRLGRLGALAGAFQRRGGPEAHGGAYPSHRASTELRGHVRLVPADRAAGALGRGSRFLLPLLSGPDHIDPSIYPVALGSPNDVDVAALRIAYYTDNGSD